MFAGMLSFSILSFLVPALEIEQEIRKFPKANGLCIAISCEKGYRFGQHIPNIHEGGRKIKAVFDTFGYATCHFRNPSVRKLVAIYRILARNMHYPTSYRRLFLFFTGHGVIDHISTEDGLINISDLISTFSNSSAPNIAGIPKIFMFDCCRNEIDGYEIRSTAVSSSSSHGMDSSNVLTLYTTLYRCKSYEGSDGAGIPTSELEKILKDSSHGSLVDIQLQLYSAMAAKVSDPHSLEHMHSVMQSSLHEPIFLHKERLDASKSLPLVNEFCIGICMLYLLAGVEVACLNTYLLEYKFENQA